ncbi:MAG: sulfotransferase [Methylococcales bacterium]
MIFHEMIRAGVAQAIVLSIAMEYQLNKSNMNQNKLKTSLQQALNFINKNQLADAHSLLMQADQLAPNNIEIFHLLSVVFGMSNDYAKSELYCKKALQINNKAALVYNNLGTAQKLQGNYKDAINSFQSTIKIQKDYIAPYVNLSNLYLEIEELSKAESLIDTAMSIDSSDLALNLALGNLYLKQDNNPQAIDIYENILYSQPQNLDAIVNLGQTYEHLGDIDKALKYYYDALDIAPNYEQSIIGIASILEKKGEFVEALKLLEPVIINSKNMKLHTICGRTHSRLKDYNKAIEILLAAKGFLAIDQHKQELFYELGDTHDKKKQYNEAFSAYQQANQINKLEFNRQATQKYFTDLKYAYTKKNLQQFASSNNQSECPIFIIGMPRSGTSLIEKILDSHSQIHGAGELEYIDDIIHELTPESHNAEYSQWIQNISSTELQKKSDEYIKNIKKTSTSSTYISNKMPHNFLHLGLIQQLFPGAKIIHCTRDHIDTALSIYFHPFNRNHPYASDLSDLHFYFQQYNHLMIHWQKEINLPIFTINYEKLINNPEHESKLLIKFCNLPWEEGCLNFHENKRLVNTPSYHQVRQPLYKSAINRHQHYLKHIGCWGEI